MLYRNILLFYSYILMVVGSSGVAIAAVLPLAPTPTPVLATASTPAQVPAQAPSLSPYLVELLINSYDNSEREQAFTPALKIVLSKSSNNKDIFNLPAIKTALTKPSLYIKQFNYVSKSTAYNKTSLVLQVTFDANAVDKLLQRVSRVAVINSKPLTLLWLAKGQGIGKILADEGVEDRLIYVLRKKAQELGLPIILPTLDMQDINNVKAFDVCHFNLQAIKTASQRYGASSIILGCIKPAFLSKMWSSQWLLLQGAKSTSYSFNGDSAESVINQALSILANNITNIITPISGQDTKVVLRISNVSGLEQYDEVVKYLQNINKAIRQIDLVNISSSEIDLAISIMGGETALVDVLHIQDRLVPNPDVTASPPGINLDYKWVPLEDDKPQTTNIKPMS